MLSRRPARSPSTLPTKKIPRQKAGDFGYLRSPKAMRAARAVWRKGGLPIGDKRSGQIANGEIIPVLSAARGRRIGLGRRHHSVTRPKIQDTFRGCVGHISRGGTPQLSSSYGTEHERGSSCCRLCRTHSSQRSKPVRCTCRLRKRRCRLHQLR